jgi:MYXO-CTERM domain-containing protein
MNVRRLFVIPILTGTLAVAATLPTFAQNTGAAADRTASARVDTDRGFDWGWLGLLGLAGLFGLKRRPDTDHYTGARTTTTR